MWRVAVDFASTPAGPWKNGAGATTELVALEGSSEFVGSSALVDSSVCGDGEPVTVAPWRLSIASLREPAAFSALPGMARSFMPVGGSVVLRIDGVDTPVPERMVCRFSGDAAVELVSLDRSCHAVNLMSTHTSTAEVHVAYGPIVTGVGSGAVVEAEDSSLSADSGAASTGAPFAAVSLSDDTELRFSLLVPTTGSSSPGASHPKDALVVVAPYVPLVLAPAEPAEPGDTASAVDDSRATAALGTRSGTMES